MNVSGWNHILSARVCLSVVAGHGLLGTVEVWGSGTVILAMYTFIVGPWLPASSAISADLIHKQSRPTHLLLLCLLLHSSKLQKCLLSPCSYGLKHQSVCSRCGHICQKSRWLDGVRQGWRPRCTRAPGVWLVCGCRCLDLHPKAEQWSQRKH